MIYMQYLSTNLLKVAIINNNRIYDIEHNILIQSLQNITILDPLKKCKLTWYTCIIHFKFGATVITLTNNQWSLKTRPKHL